MRASLNSQTQVLIGTLYKEMKGKPNVLQELEAAAKFTYDDDGKVVDSKKTKGDDFAREDDTFMLEDESGRVDLISTNGSLDVHKFVTGMVIAAKGKITSEGSFDVQALCGPIYEQKKEDDNMTMDTDEDAYVLLVSGLNMGSSDGIHLPHILADYITGHLGDDDEFVSKISRVLVVGNSIKKKNMNKDTDGDENEEGKQNETIVSRLRGVQPLEQLDLVLSQILSSVPLDLIPGENDPTNFVLPQQPLHPCLLPESARYTSFRTTTNPYHSEIGKVSFLGTSGQNIRDIMRCTLRKSLKTPCDALEMIVRFCHLAPTAPDTLGCFPFMMRDPFVVTDCPDIMFSGDCDAFETRLIDSPQYENKKTRLVCVPNFSKTGVAALVNLKDFSCRPISFGLDH